MAGESMMMWRSDKELMAESLSKAFRLSDDETDRFERLIAELKRQDERLRDRELAHH